MDILRFATAGSVDDGKSTLIGRLLYDTKTVFADQIESVERASKERGDDYVNLALLTDGLRAEREQGITIDVAYRYFATPKRKFIIADTPGHIQYTRNMVTGASTADLALVLVDARNGHRRAEPAARVPGHAARGAAPGAVRQQDGPGRLLRGGVRPDPRGVHRVRDQAATSPDLTVIPVSALKGDNVVTRSTNMPWYDGPSLLHHLENVHVASDRNLIDVALPGAVRDPAAVRRLARLPRLRRPGRRRRAQARRRRDGAAVRADHDGSPSIDTADGPVEEAFPPMSVTVRLEDELDVSRGDMICRPHNAPTVTQDIDAMVCWMDETSRCGPARKFAIKHTTRAARAVVQGPAATGWTSTRCTATRGGRAAAQRDRPGQAAHHAAAVRDEYRATGRPAGSSSSTRPPTARSAPG